MMVPAGMSHTSSLVVRDVLMIDRSHALVCLRLAISYCSLACLSCAALWRGDQDELALATYEALKWKEKYLEEKQRRRTLAKSLLDSMTLHDRGRSPTDTRPSSSAFSDVDHIESILSPTLSSFDFDDDDESGSDASNNSEDDDDEAAVDVVSPVHNYRARNGSCLSPSGRLNGAFQDAAADYRRSDRRSGTAATGATRPNRSSTTGSLRDSIRLSLAQRDGTDSSSGNGAASGAQTMPPQSLIYRMMYSKPSARDLWQSRAQQQQQQARHHAKFSTVARSLLASMHLRKERVFENFFVVGLTIGAAERAHAAKNAESGFVGFWKPRVLLQYPHVRSTMRCSPLTLTRQTLTPFCLCLSLILSASSRRSRNPAMAPPTALSQTFAFRRASQSLRARRTRRVH